MNRPRITKEALKELRGKLLAEQNAQNQAKSQQSENDREFSKPGAENSVIEKDHEQEMDM